MKKFILPLMLLVMSAKVLASGAYIGVPTIPPRDTRYNVGQAAVAGRGLPGGRSCSSCHSGGRRFQRGRLKRIKGRLGSYIRNCRIHYVYCRGGSKASSSLIPGSTVSAIVYYLIQRYQVK